MLDLISFDENKISIPSAFCKKCKSTNVKKNGSSHGKPKVICRNCNATTILDAPQTYQIANNYQQKWLKEYRNHLKKIEKREQHLKYFLNMFIKEHKKALDIISGHLTNKLIIKRPFDFVDLKEFLCNYVDLYETKYNKKNKIKK